MSGRSGKKETGPGGFSLFEWVVSLGTVAFVAFVGAFLYFFAYNRGYRDGIAAKARQEINISRKTKAPEPAQPPLRQQKSHVAVPSGPRKAPQKELPRLAVIIDDMAYGYQVKALKSLGLPITPSFFPPTPHHPHTPALAHSFSHYMVHLPLEAMEFSRKESVTLGVDTDKKEMRDFLGRIRRYFPKALYINNHTGSKFTADEKAVRRLVDVLDQYGFGLIDSRTTKDTAIPRVMRSLGRPYLHRDIFLDNKADIAYIQGQIKKAVARAKRRGYAIAIGHPRPKTFEALRRSKGLFKEVRLIYVDDL